MAMTSTEFIKTAMIKIRSYLFEGHKYYFHLMILKGFLKFKSVFCIYLYFCHICHVPECTVLILPCISCEQTSQCTMNHGWDVSHGGHKGDKLVHVPFSLQIQTNKKIIINTFNTAWLCFIFSCSYFNSEVPIQVLYSFKLFYLIIIQISSLRDCLGQ